MELYNAKRDAFIGLELVEIGTNRANGAGIHLYFKKKRLNAKFFNLWIEKDRLLMFVRGLKKILSGKANVATLNSPNKDDLYITLMKKDLSFYIGVKASAYNFTPIKLTDSVTLSFEIEAASIPPFIKELENILNKL